MKNEQFENLIKDDWWIYGSDILDYKLADKIINFGCSKNLLNNYNIIEKNNVTYLVINDRKCPLYN